MPHLIPANAKEANAMKTNKRVIFFTLDGLTGAYDVENDHVSWATISCCYADAPKAIRARIRLNA